MAEIEKLMEQTKPKALQIRGNVRHVLVVMSGKGGVGKSTIAANLAASLASDGLKVGILDSDFHGPTIPKLLGASGKLEQTPEGKLIPVKANGVKIVSIALAATSSDRPMVWRGPIKMIAVTEFLTKTEWGELDYLLIDLPPGTGEEPLTIAQLLPDADGAIIVSTPQDVALLAVRKSVSFAKLVNLPVIGLIENMAGDIFGEGGGEKAAKEMSIDFLGRIPLDKRIAQSGECGKPFSVEDKEFLRTFGLIVDRVRRKVE